MTDPVTDPESAAARDRLRQAVDVLKQTAALPADAPDRILSFRVARADFIDAMAAYVETRLGKELEL